MGWGRGPGQRGRFVTLNFCEREGATAASRSWSRSELWNRAVVPSCGAELWKRGDRLKSLIRHGHGLRFTTEGGPHLIDIPSRPHPS
jgi:hypothetical protein